MTVDGGGTGSPPVRILRPESSVTSETTVREKLISAASIFADLVRPTYGPKGLDKMLYKSNGEAAITNDGAKIVSELMVKHPTAKAFVSLGQSQESVAGDGVTGCLLFAGALMYEAGLLINKGLHPLVIIDGYQEACDIAVSKIKEQSFQCDEQGLLNVATTSLTGKVTSGASIEIAKVVVNAVKEIKTNSICDSENVLMAKSLNNAPMSTKLIKGVILDKKIHLDKTPSKIKDCKVVLINGDLDFRKPSRDTEIEINTPNELTEFIENEDKSIEKISQKLISLNVNAVFSTGEINKEILHKLISKNIFVLGGLTNDELVSISRASKATTCPRIEDISLNELGLIGLLRIESLNKEGEIKQRIFIENCPNSELMTIDVGGSDDLMVEETIRSIHDSIKSTCLAARTKNIVRGGGNSQSLAAVEVMSIADGKQGRERLGMEGFSKALETIPATLAANAGKSSLDKVIELRSRLKNESNELGVNVEGEISKIQSVYEPLDSVTHSIILATETVAGLLRVDQLISARGD